MAIEITMPRLSDTMEQGTVVTWHVSEGDAVSAGDVIADIETDKATMELQTFDDGTMARRVIGEGEQVSVGALIAVLAEEGESVEDAASSAGAGAGAAASGGGDQQRARASEESAGAAGGSGSDAGGAASGSGSSAAATASGDGAAGSAAAGGTGPNGTNGSGGGRIFASPLARKIAEERGLDLSSIQGSGPSGRIVRRDVEQVQPAGRAAPEAGARSGVSAGTPEPAAPAPAAGGGGLASKRIPLSNMRATIARRLVEAKQSVPHYQVTVEASMDAMLALRGQLNEQLEAQGVKLSVNDFLVRACALALHQHPHLNSSWGEDGQSVQIHGEVNVGVAVALPVNEDLTGGGLVVATLRNADAMGLRRISSETGRLARKAREKGLTIEEMSDATFTISNLGMFGVSHFTAIINPPNAAILAVGAAEERPVVRDGEVVPGRVMSMTLSSDHRIVDGAMAAQFLQSVKQYLENPATVLV